MITIIVIDKKVTLIESIFLLAFTPCYIIFNFWIRKYSFQHIPCIKESTGLPELNSKTGILNNPEKYIKTPIVWFYDRLVPIYTGKLWQILYSFVVIIITGFFITRGTIFCMERIMCHIHISESLLGLTIIAWGNNIGDIMNSAVAAKRGNAQLAVSAVLATQILNLVFSLGFPWSISIGINGNLEVGDVTTLNSMYFAMGIVWISFLCLLVGRIQLKLSVGIMLSCLYIFYVSMEWFVLSEES